MVIQISKATGQLTKVIIQHNEGEIWLQDLDYYFNLVIKIGDETFYSCNQFFPNYDSSDESGLAPLYDSIIETFANGINELDRRPDVHSLEIKEIDIPDEIKCLYNRSLSELSQKSLLSDAQIAEIKVIGFTEFAESRPFRYELTPPPTQPA